MRQTEYTSVGPAAMPGDLPATSGYTYAAELAIDEAQAAGATSVEFTAATPARTPRVNYVENFIGAPVGSGVPSGSLRPRRGRVGAGADGRVVKVISETAGRADLDTDGDGDSDGADYPAALKITDGERAALAPLYAPGASSGASRSTHFSAVGPQLAVRAPAGRRLPRLGPDGQPLPPGCPQPASSTIDCEDQRLREELPVPGTPYSLVVLVGLGAEPGRPQDQGPRDRGLGPGRPDPRAPPGRPSRADDSCAATRAPATRATTTRRR